MTTASKQFAITLTLLAAIIFCSSPLVSAQTSCATAVSITVKTKDVDCFTNYIHVVTTDIGTAFAPPGTCSTSDDNAWWGTFTATGTTTNFFMWGKDKDNANFIVYSGNCSALTQILCIPTKGDRDPMSGIVTTVPGQTYYILIHHKMTEARLCVYSQGAEVTKPVCTAGMSFEDGTGAGWQPSNGSYHLVSAPGVTFMNDLVPGSPAGRFQLTSGTGGDAMVGRVVPVVAPGGGTHSYRIGWNGGTSSAFSDPQPAQNGFNPGTTHASVEQMTYCFTVDPTNAGFGYKYSTIMDAPFHAPELQPLFEAFLTVAATGDTIPCGKHEHFPGDGKSPFHYIGQNTDVASNSGMCFTPWTDVLTDLTGYAGQQVCATFRVRDCEGGNVTTCCPYDLGLVGGSHGAYAYFDTYCIPMTINVPEFCAGVASFQICAPAGYQTYSWPSGQPGLSGSPTTQCVTINNPVAGTTYNVNMTSFTGCPSNAKVKIKNIPLTRSADTTLCTSHIGNIPLSVSVTNPLDPPYTFSWSGGVGTGSIIQVNPTATTSYIVTVTNKSGCSSTDTINVTLSPCAFPPKAVFQSSDTAFCNESGECVDFFDLSTGNPSSWKWTFPGAIPDTSTMQNPTSICYYNPGTYAVKLVATNANGSDSMVVSSHIIFASGAIAPNITISHDTLYCSPAAAYQWYLNGSPIPGATSSFYVATTDGSYNVYITDDYGCSRLGNAVTYTSVNQLNGSHGIKIYPNPAKDKFEVSGLKFEAGTVIELYNVLGEKVYSQLLSSPRLQTTNLKPQTVTVDISTLAKGIYILQIKAKDIDFYTRLVKD